MSLNIVSHRALPGGTFLILGEEPHAGFRGGGLSSAHVLPSKLETPFFLLHCSVQCHLPRVSDVTCATCRVWVTAEPLGHSSVSHASAMLYSPASPVGRGTGRGIQTEVETSFQPPNTLQCRKTLSPSSSESHCQALVAVSPQYTRKLRPLCCVRASCAP